MHKKDKTVPAAVSQLKPPAQLKDDVPDVRERNIAQRENAVIDDEAALLSREKSATAREEAADLREDAAGLREDAAQVREGAAEIREDEAQIREEAVSVREQDIHEAEPQTGSGNRVKELRQANALVSATLDAHKLIAEIETAKVELDHMTHHDVLTDLPNRILLNDRLSQAIEQAHRQGRQLAVMSMDLDQFKHINDSLGHAVGDQLLGSVAERLVTCVYHSDTISRPGGDEFVLLFPYIERAENVATTAQNILAALTLPHRIDQHSLHISASIGISLYPDDGKDAETLIKNADTAMYHAKESGRNTYKFFEQSMSVRAVRRQYIEASLRIALEERQFVLYYQPKINLESGLIVGVEALIRWQHPERGLVPPAEFIPIAEDCGLILPIDRWVLREACSQAETWRQAGLPPIIMSVNTSALEFRARDFLENIQTTLADTGFEARYLELELTEGLLMENAESTNAMLHALTDLFIKLAIDDFGTGYSSLSYLQKFPINTLKIDQSFVKQMTSKPDDAAIVSAVISMAKSLKLSVIAEGVETAEQYAFLRTKQCDEGQGYYFGRPMTADALAGLLQTGLSPTLSV